jgi:hypothetical protein
VGGPTLQRVPMLEPGRGNAESVEALIDRAASASELIELLRDERPAGMRR